MRREFVPVTAQITSSPLPKNRATAHSLTPLSSNEVAVPISPKSRLVLSVASLCRSATTIRPTFPSLVGQLDSIPLTSTLRLKISFVAPCWLKTRVKCTWFFDAHQLPSKVSRYAFGTNHYHRPLPLDCWFNDTIHPKTREHFASFVQYTPNHLRIKRKQQA